MKKYKNFDEIRRKVLKTIKKILEVKKMISFKYLLKFRKKLRSFLRKFYVNFMNLKDSIKISDKSGIKLRKLNIKLLKILN